MSLTYSGDLFSGLAASPAAERLAEDAVLLRGYLSSETTDLVAAIRVISDAAPFRHMVTRGGFTMSVAMTNCGAAGWTSDETGYRYTSIDPLTGIPWPSMPALFSRLARSAAALSGFAGFHSDACLINRYEPGARMSLHQDRDEVDMAQPIVSFSLGLPAIFLFGGATRKDRPRRLRIEHGDVVVWGRSARLTYHGVAPLADGEHPITGRCRLNLTFRKAL
jgi:alkylated DNA repair protein (DNA oxidative demethylase)